jgi:D-alanine-D-alanine ligase
MIKVIVLAGGTSDEREVSLRSGAAVAKALGSASNEYEVTSLDPADGLENLLPRLKQADVVFPVLHGAGGEDGTLQKFLEDHKIKYVGSDRWASALCFDKAGYTKLLAKHHVLVPATQLVNYNEFQASPLRKKPFVLKPNDGGSSIDTFIVRNPQRVDHDAIEQAFASHTKMLLQELIEGVEITVALLGDEALPVIEIIPPADGEFDYENKYNGQTQELCPPKHINEENQKKAQDLATRIHNLTRCHDLSRTDMIITKHDELYVLETNTIPGLTEESLVPKAANVAGISMLNLCSKLVIRANYHIT